MSVKVRIPTQLRTLTGGRARYRSRARRSGEVLKALDTAHAGFADRIFDETGRPAPLRQRLPGRRGRAVPRRAGDAGRRWPDLSIVPAVAGG